MLDFELRNQVFEENHIPIADYFIPIKLDSIFSNGPIQTLYRPEDSVMLLENISKLKIFGKNGAGKSHLLYCFGVHIHTRGYLPLYFDLSVYEQVELLADAVQKQIDLIETTPNHQSNSFCFLFDNHGHFSTVLDSYLEELMATHAECKFVFTTSEHIEASLKFDVEYQILPIAEVQAYTLWKMIDSRRKSNVSYFIRPLVEMYPDVFKPYLTNPLFVLLLYRVCIFFQAARGTDLDAFKPIPNRNKFFRLRYAMEQVLLHRFKIRTQHKEQQVIKNNYQSPRVLPVRPVAARTFVIEPHSNGIGDLLWFSHLPRIAKESGKYDQVLVVRKCKNELIWDCNPYVDGYTDEVDSVFKVHGQEIDKIIPLVSAVKPSNAVEVNQQFYDSRKINLLDWVMLRLGFDNGRRFNKAELYYKPTKIKALENKTQYDPYWWSNPRIETKNFFELDRYFRKQSIHLDYQMRFIDDPTVNSKYTMIPITHFEQFLSTYSLFDFCDVLASVKHVYCLTTGTAHLTDALNVKTTVLMDEPQSAVHHTLDHNYVNILNG